MKKTRIKAIVATAVVSVITACGLCSCEAVEPTGHLGLFDYAYVTLPNGECKEGSIKGYSQVTDNILEVVFDDGTIYRTGANSIVLVSN